MQRYTEHTNEFPNSRQSFCDLLASELKRHGFAGSITFDEKRFNLSLGDPVILIINLANMFAEYQKADGLEGRHQGILTNPAEAVELLPADAATRTTFTREQIKVMLAVADIEWQGMILFGACHGLRIGDAARLSWANINAERQTLRFVAEKKNEATKEKEKSTLCISI